jgi:uncharacterized membrane protein
VFPMGMAGKQVSVIIAFLLHWHKFLQNSIPSENRSTACQAVLWETFCPWLPDRKG